MRLGVKLGVNQREAIRAIQDGDDRTPAISTRVITSLKRNGYIENDTGPRPRVRLTAKGKRAYDEIMESGDGPEALKEMFRF